LGFAGNFLLHSAHRGHLSNLPVADWRAYMHTSFQPKSSAWVDIKRNATVPEHRTLLIQQVDYLMFFDLCAARNSRGLLAHIPTKK
jgi:hypothetical protein